MEEQKNFVAAYKLYEACSPKKEAYSEAFRYVWFSRGYAYASNRHIVVRANIKNISSFTEEEIALLDGKKIERDLFKQLLKHEYVDIREDGFYAQEENKEVLYRFDSKEDIKMPKFENIIQDAIQATKHGTPLTAIGISAVEFQYLAKAIGAEGSLSNKLALRFSNPNSAIIVEHCNELIDFTIGLIMPILLD